jgi:hypothetical protein
VQVWLRRDTPYDPNLGNNSTGRVNYTSNRYKLHCQLRAPPASGVMRRRWCADNELYCCQKWDAGRARTCTPRPLNPQAESRRLLMRASSLCALIDAPQWVSALSVWTRFHCAPRACRGRGGEQSNFKRHVWDALWILNRHSMAVISVPTQRSWHHVYNWNW